MSGQALVAIKSHRARQRLERLLGVERLDTRLVAINSPATQREYAYIPASRETDALKIPGIGRGKPRGELIKPWRMVDG